MTLEQASFISQILSGVGVIASLIFVGVQLGQNTRALRAQIHQNVLAGWLGVGPMVTENAKAFAAGLAADETEFAALANEDKLTFMATIFVFFKHYENMYLQHKEGFIREKDWNAWVNHMYLYWRTPGVQMWWKERRGAFSPDFCSFIEQSPDPAMRAQTEFFVRPAEPTAGEPPAP